MKNKVYKNEDEIDQDFPGDIGRENANPILKTNKDDIR